MSWGSRMGLASPIAPPPVLHQAGAGRVYGGDFLELEEIPVDFRTAVCDLHVSAAELPQIAPQCSSVPSRLHMRPSWAHGEH